MTTEHAQTSSAAAEAWGLFLDLAKAHRPIFDAIAAEMDVTPQMAFMLKVLTPGSPTPMNEVADSLGCDASNITGIADKLESRGFLERRSAPGDRRVKYLALTHEGVEHRQRLYERLAQAPDAIAALSIDDQVTLRDLLRRVLDATQAASR